MISAEQYDKYMTECREIQQKLITATEAAWGKYPGIRFGRSRERELGQLRKAANAEIKELKEKYGIEVGESLPPPGYESE